MWNLSFSSYVYQYVNISYVINSSILGGKRDRRRGGAWGMEVVNGCEEGKWPQGESSWHAKRAGASISLIPFTQICKPFNLRLSRLCFLSIRLFKPMRLIKVQLLKVQTIQHWLKIHRIHLNCGFIYDSRQWSITDWNQKTTNDKPVLLSSNSIRLIFYSIISTESNYTN